MKYVFIFILITCGLTGISQSVVPSVVAQKKSGSQLLFIENKGQVTDFDGNPQPDILFVLKAPDVTIFLRKNGLSYLFTKCNQPELFARSRDKFKHPGMDTLREKNKITYTTYRLDVAMLNSNPQATVKAIKPTEYYENYYNVLSHPEGIVDVKSYDKITIENLYHGIDWVLYTKDGKLKYDLIIREAADYKQIQVKYSGANEIKLNPDGTLLVNTPLGSVTEEKPYAYQVANQLEVFSQYKIDGDIVSFDINDAQGKSIVIDPGVIWSTYYGGSKDDEGWATCTDASENAFLAGTTPSINYTASSGAHQDIFSGGMDAFLVKFNSIGQRLWATYYGGSGDEEGRSICTDANNNIFLAGTTSSTTNIGYNGHQDTFSGSNVVGTNDAFLVKFNSSGIRQWGTYYGTSNYNEGHATCIDKTGNVYLAGYTRSTTGISYNGHQNTFAGGSSDMFLVKFNNNGTRLWATYYGGNNTDEAFSVCTDASENVYLAGYVSFRGGLASNGHQNTFGGVNDAILIKFNKNGTRLWATYYGGSGIDHGFSACTDLQGNVYLAGLTGSLTGISYNGYQNIAGWGYLGYQDAFLVKFDSNGVRKWGTYYGGNDVETGMTVSSDNFGNIYLAGFTVSRNGISHGGMQNTFAGGMEDAFLAKFDTQGTLLWGTYFGVNGSDEGRSVCIDISGNVYLAGMTSGGGTNIGLNGYQTISISYQDAFLAKFFPEKALFEPFKKTIFCPGDSLLIKFDKISKMNYSNKYTFQLSDTAGNFDNGIVLFTKTDSIKGLDSITVHLPINLLPSSHYSLRMFTTSPTDTIYSQDSIRIKQKPLAKYTVNDSTQCGYTNNFIFTNNSTIDSGKLSYKWYYGDSTVSDSVSPFKSYSNFGKYTVILVANSDYGCIDSALQTVSVNPKPIVNFAINDSIQCLRGNNFIFNNISTISSGALNYAWNFGDSNVSNAPSPSRSYSATGNYKVGLKAISSDNCSDSVFKSIQINGHPQAVINTIANNLCPGDTAKFEAVGTAPQDKIHWLKNSAANAVDTLPQLKSDIPVNIRLILVNSEGCLDSSTIVQTIFKQKPSKPIINKSGLSLDVGTGYATYQWYKNGQVLNNETAQSYIVNQNNTYYCNVTNTDGCEEWSDTVSITGLSIKNNTKENSFELYPNPSQGLFTIDFGNIITTKTIKVYNINGQVLYEKLAVDKTVLLNLQYLSPGIYLVVVEHDYHIENVRIIIE